MKLAAQRLILSLAASSLAIGCGDSGGDDLTLHTGTAKVSAELDREGGRLQLQSGLELEVPEGALDRPVKLELEELRSGDLPEVRDGMSLEKPVAFRPHGQSFTREVSIDVPIDSVPEGRELRVLRLDDEADAEWEIIQRFERRSADEFEGEQPDQARGRDRIELRTTGFSVYWVVAVPAGTDAGLKPDGGFSDVGDPDAGADSGAPRFEASTDDPCADFQCEPDSVCQVDVDGAPICVAQDAGAVTFPDGGTGRDDSGTLTPDAGTPDAGPPPPYSTCAEAFTALGIDALECTGTGGSLGYECEGVVRVSADTTCDALCASWGSTCSAAYTNDIMFACNSRSGATACDDLSTDFYCACGIMP